MNDGHFERLKGIVDDHGLLPIVDHELPIGGMQDPSLEEGGTRSGRRGKRFGASVGRLRQMIEGASSGSRSSGQVVQGHEVDQAINRLSGQEF